MTGLRAWRNNSAAGVRVLDADGTLRLQHDPMTRSGLIWFEIYYTRLALSFKTVAQ